jgi:hypothetical protein
LVSSLLEEQDRANVCPDGKDEAGAAIQDVNILTIAGQIVAVEARHASYLNLVDGNVPFPDSFDSLLSKDEVLAIAGPFITA